MNLKDIDKLFNEHQHQFDKMPSDKLWERLEEKLDSTPAMWGEEKPAPKVRWLRYVAAAAVILVMMVPAIYMMDNAPHKSSDIAMEQPAMYDKTEATRSSRADRTELEPESAGEESMAMDSESEIRDVDGSAPTVAIEEKESVENKQIIAANRTTTAKDKSVSTSKPKPTQSFNNSPQSKTRSIEKPNPVASTAPNTTNRSLPLPLPSESKPSMSADSDMADMVIEEEAMEMEEDAAMSLEEVGATGYSMPAAKAETAKIKATFDISNANGTYAYARYNVDFNQSNFSNMLPHDGYGNGRYSQSTLEIESAKEVQSTKTGSAKKSKDKSSDNVALKRNASKADMDDALSAKSLGFLHSLEGNWSLYLNGMFFEENWKMTPNGSLLGTAKTLQNGAVLFAENINIQALQGNKMAYTIHHPNNSQTLTYQLRTSQTSVDNENYLVFDNPQNDFPNTITYRLVEGSDLLKITFEGKKDGKPIFKELILNRE